MYGLNSFEYSAEVICESICSQIDDVMNWIVLESGEGSERNGNFIKVAFTKLKEACRKFYEWIVDMLSKFFSRNEVSLVLKKNDVDSSDKIQLSQKNEKLIEEGKITLKELEKCKTAKDVDKAMTAYRRKRAAIKAGKVVITIAAIAGMAWLHKKKNTEIERYKKEAKEESDKLAMVQEELLKTRSDAAKERSKMRAEIETANAKTLSMAREVEQMKRDNAKATTSGQLQAVIELQKAKVEVKKDQVNAIIQKGGEIVKALANGNISDAVKNASSTHESIRSIPEAKTRELKSKNEEVAQRGKRIKENIDKAIAVLDSDTTNLDRGKDALEYLVKNEPKLHQLGGNYAVRAKGIISRENAERKNRIKDRKVKGNTLAEALGESVAANVNKAISILDSPTSKASSIQKADAYLKKYKSQLEQLTNNRVAKKALSLIGG